MRQMSPRELQDHLAEADQPPVLLDVREPWEYQRCRIDGSKLIPMGEIPSAYQELNPDDEIVVICHHGVRSQQVCWFLSQAGFHRVVNLAGGIDAWARDVDPHMATY
ncbi:MULTISPECIES: rhodanese-like domain-containing protein [unclassified Thioalkalivibrio]|uniref:rhodanese-like domain-containing protein n=1 Tax=unclassified Thioalkalivibrio TaxID=2621013 RepID=UPI00036A366E|nr:MULTISPECIES: rhodanese-like domain-containing protein [unclassified Thioalkalivibrio]